ncbi:Hypothetical protein, putative [Bodo saltans]|uniref:Uncharacterized protein n=1 Tax=Bodo saltans TaxID=75058 RepID=A0A0S4J0N3_BODSA|nr:Hypothetical protein, putative [Bodo saltans]|eukprot:CUG77587.1 Hypothetical protein, putative [Bodo saltans]
MSFAALLANTLAPCKPSEAQLTTADRWMNDDCKRHGLTREHVTVIRMDVESSLVHRNAVSMLYYKEKPAISVDSIVPIALENVKFAIREMRMRTLGSVKCSGELVLTCVAVTARWYGSWLPCFFQHRDKYFLKLAAEEMVPIVFSDNNEGVGEKAVYNFVYDAWKKFSTGPPHEAGGAEVVQPTPRLRKPRCDRGKKRTPQAEDTRPVVAPVQEPRQPVAQPLQKETRPTSYDGASAFQQTIPGREGADRKNVCMDGPNAHSSFLRRSATTSTRRLYCPHGRLQPLWGDTVKYEDTAPVPQSDMRAVFGEGDVTRLSRCYCTVGNDNVPETAPLREEIRAKWEQIDHPYNPKPAAKRKREP